MVVMRCFLKSLLGREKKKYTFSLLPHIRWLVMGRGMQIILYRIIRPALVILFALLLSVNSQFFAEAKEMYTATHLNSFEMQNNKEHPHFHEKGHSRNNFHSHKHRHSKDEPEHEHHHSDCAFFSVPSIAQALLPQSTSDISFIFSAKLCFATDQDAPIEGFVASNFRPPIA